MRNYKYLIRRHRRRKAILLATAAFSITAMVSCTALAFNSLAALDNVSKEVIEISSFSQPINFSEIVEEEPEPKYILTESEQELLLKIAMAEAEGETTEGKALVMLVVLNRVESENFPASISEVIYQKGQFSPVRSGRFDSVTPNEDCSEALSLVLGGWNQSQGATYFRTTTNESTWHSRNLEELFSCGNHTFYE